MSNITWLGKGHKLFCECKDCYEEEDQIELNSELNAIKDRLRHYQFADKQQESDFIDLMLMAEKLRK